MFLINELCVSGSCVFAAHSDAVLIGLETNPECTL